MKKCGEDFTSSTGTLQSPSYPYTMDLKQFCKWTFNITNSTLVYLTVINLDLGDEDNFTVSDGISPDIIYDGINGMTSTMKCHQDLTVMWQLKVFENVFLYSVPDKNIFVLSSVNSSIAISIGANQLETPRRFFASFTTLGN